MFAWGNEEEWGNHRCSTFTSFLKLMISLLPDDIDSNPHCTVVHVCLYLVKWQNDKEKLLPNVALAINTSNIIDTASFAVMYGAP